MQITVTIQNPNLGFLAALASLSAMTPDFRIEMGDLDGLFGTKDAPKPEAAPAPQTAAEAAPAATRIFAPDCDLIGKNVHWAGARFTFDGTITDIRYGNDEDDKVIFVRRADTGKLVSLTLDDLQNHHLTLAT